MLSRAFRRHPRSRVPSGDGRTCTVPNTDERSFPMTTETTTEATTATATETTEVDETTEVEGPVRDVLDNDSDDERTEIGNSIR